MNWHKTKIIIGALVVLSVGAGIGFFFFHSTSAVSSVVPVEGDATSSPLLIDPSVISSMNQHFIINFKPLRDQFTAIQNEYSQKTYIYFLYLNNSAWVGLNERDNFTAASTVKVPLAMALMKAVEDGKLKLTDAYTLDDLDMDSNFGNLYKTGDGETFTVDALTKIMLEQSDNTAARGIINIFQKIGISDPLADIYNAMGWGDSPNLLLDLGQPANYTDINLKMLSNMFLALYEASYVNVDHSEEILNYLDNTPFTDKIEAGIPGNGSIHFAHKIGISDSDKTYSDCGIVYAPSRNYILCAGSSGADQQTADDFMVKISRAAYNYVINN